MPGSNANWLPDDCEALLIVPPMGDAYVPSMAAHLLQACAGLAGFRVRVFYANMLLASMVGEDSYEALWCGPAYRARIGERLFAAAAYGLPPLGRGVERLRSQYDELWTVDPDAYVEWDELLRIERGAREWADTTARVIARGSFRVVGCTTAYQQTSASVALLDRVKRLRPDVVTILGGANCEGEMAAGIASLRAAIDYIFSGESEATFPRFLESCLSNRPPAGHIVQGEPCQDLDALPLPSYADFFEQLACHFRGSTKATQSVVLPYETSRGCWWGQKHHCTFCGLNGFGMQFRQKSAERALTDLRTLVDDYASSKVVMADNIMPHTYFRTLIPRLANELLDVRLFYEMKANLSLEKVLALGGARVVDIQPGIEAFSSSLLRRMKKGVTASQNIALLRYARSARFERVQYHLLYAFPGDTRSDFEQILEILPMLHHLYPPIGVMPVSIDRFSPYFEHPEDYGVVNKRPIEAYAEVYPAHADLGKLAYHFVADYESASRGAPDLIEEIKREVAAWRQTWTPENRTPPELWVHQISKDTFLLEDTRCLSGASEIQFMTRAQAAAALVGGPSCETATAAWALEQRLAVNLDGCCVPLATGDPGLLLGLEAEASETRRPAVRGVSQPADASLDAISGA